MAKQQTFKKIILDDLKAQGLQVIAAKINSIRYETFSMGSAVRVEARNLFKRERETLERILREYQHGSFDGMTDCYNYEESKKPRSAKWVTLNHEFSEEVKAEVKANLAHMFGVTDNESAQAKFGQWYDVVVWRKLQELENDPTVRA